ncbi:class I glutamine amidotransferase-like protein [Geopyxis carbonaria]|nr:class I glutamine amidotransferase-like protein [Geopyxis carbonaria]
MQFLALFSTAALAAAGASAAAVAAPANTTASTIPPTNIGLLLFPGFQAIDVFGPLDIMNTLSFTHPNLKMSILSRTLCPVSTKAVSMNSTFGQSVVPTHTLDAPPEDLQVLLVPGGVGTRSPDLVPEVEFLRTIYPKLEYIVSVCTGAGLLARAGVLDGRRATGNKKAWKWVTAQGNNTHWVSKARWVEDGNVWTTSGLTAGIDGTYAWVASIWGEEVAAGLAAGQEYERTTDWQDDPWGVYYNLTDVVPAGM